MLRTYLLCIVLAILALAITAISLFRTKFQSRNDWKEICLLGCFGIGIFLSIPGYFITYNENHVLTFLPKTCFDYAYYIVRGIIYGTSSMVGTSDIEIIPRIHLTIQPVLSPFIGDKLATVIMIVYCTLLLAIRVFAPIVTSVLLFQLLGLSLKQIKYRWIMHWRNDVHIFSDMNERSLELANSIRDQEQWSPIIFCSADDSSMKGETYINYKKLRALALKTTMKELTFSRYLLGRKIHLHFYQINDDSDTNISGLHEIVNEFHQLSQKSNKSTRCKIEIVVFSTDQTTPDYIDAERAFLRNNSALADNISLVLYNELLLSCYNLLFNHPYVEEATNNTRHLLLVGGGHFGKEFIKMVAWTSRLYSFRTTLDVIDKDSDRIANELRLACPDLDFSLHNITFHKANVYEGNFEDTLNVIRTKLNPSPASNNVFCDYIVVSLGNDQVTYDTATMLRQYCLRNSSRKNYFIALKILDKIKADAIKTLPSDKTNSVKYEVFGGIPTIYNIDKLHNFPIKEIAEDIHLYTNVYITNPNLQKTDKQVIKEIKRYYDSEYLQSSSYSCALHLKFKKILLTEKELSDTLLEELARYEHDRWCSYMQTKGFRKIDKEQIKDYYLVLRNHSNPEAKLTPCLVDWNELPAVNASIHELAIMYNGKTPQDFQSKDKNVIRFLFNKYMK